MSETVLSVTEAARHFSEVISRVTYRRESFILRKGKRRMAELRPLPSGLRLGDLPGVLRSIPRVAESDVDAFAKDVETARSTLDRTEPRDPWAS